MTRPVSSTLKTTSKAVLKSPLRASTMPLLAPSEVSQEADNPGHGSAGPRLGVTAQQLRRMQISEFSAWLRTQTNKHHRPFQEETIRGYAETARALDLCMAKENIDGDFTAYSVDVLNTFFAVYRNAHSRSRRSAMTFPGSWTARGARHRASPADRPRARPVTSIASHSKTAPACETRPGRPPTPRRRRRVHYSSPEKVLRLEPDGALDKPYPPRSKAVSHLYR